MSNEEPEILPNIWPGVDLTLRQWARQYDWAVTTVEDCYGHEETDPPSGWALYDAGEDDPPIAVFNFRWEAEKVAQCLQEFGQQEEP